ncbi:MAG: cytochrome b/b6 domain-containing protein [Planctomycetota bacterium]
MKLRILDLLLAAACAAGTAAAQSDGCLECHDGTDGGFTPLAYRAGVHGAVPCTDCHRRVAGAFDSVPHKKDEPDLTRCTACHGLNLKEFRAELKSGVHGDMACSECHDAHTMPKDPGAIGSEPRNRLANASCLKCHADADLLGDGKAHAWLPRREAHARMRCMVCHAPLGAEHSHEIVRSELATRSCEACHTEQAPLVGKYVGEDDRSSWVTNPLLFEKAYVPGAVRHRLVDRIVLALFALTVAGALAHGLLRMVARALRTEAPFEVASSNLFPLGLRLWHWANALLVTVLAVTGLRLHFGGRKAPILTFETAFDVHNLAGILLVALGIVFFVRNAVTGDTRQYLGKLPGGFRGLVLQARFYVVGIFRGAEHPYHATRERRFNPLQQMGYATAMYVLLPILILTGVILLYPQVLPERIGGRPAAWWFATAHYLSAVLMIAFVLGHIYLATTGDRVRYFFTAMITGLYRHHVRKDSTGQDR